MSNLIALTCPFRSGSTLAWAIFRAAGHWTCYNEPLHPLVTDLLWRGGHDAFGNTWAEFDRLDPRRLAELHSRDWNARRLWMDETDQDDRLEAYLRFLIDGAGGRPVMLKLNRMGLRLRWFAKHFPEADVYQVYRPIRDIWASYRAVFARECPACNDEHPSFHKLFSQQAWHADLAERFPALAAPVPHPYARLYILHRYLYDQFTQVYGTDGGVIEYASIEADVSAIIHACGVEPAAGVKVRPPTTDPSRYHHWRWFDDMEAAAERIMAAHGPVVPPQGPRTPPPTRTRHCLGMLHLMARSASEGDVIECGVGGATTTWALAGWMRDREWPGLLFACDTFEGLPYTDAATGFPPSDLRRGECAVLTLAEFDRQRVARDFGDLVVPVAGLFEQSLSGLADRRFALAWIDPDLGRSTQVAWEFVAPRVVPGGIVGFHDYGFSRTPNVTKVVDEQVRTAPGWRLLLHDADCIFFQKERQ